MNNIYIMRFLVLTLLLLSSCHTVFGQEFSTVNYDSKDGLAGSVVYCIAEDKEGFLWFGTETGLSRFDGTHFHNFSTADGLPDDEVLHLFADSRGRVWIMPFRHSVCYYWKGRIHNQDNDSLLHSLSFDSEIVSISEDGDGNIFISEYFSIYMISPDGKVGRINRIKGAPFQLTLVGGIGHDGKTYHFAVLDQWLHNGSISHGYVYQFYDLNKGKLAPAEKRFFHSSTNFNSTLWSPAFNILCADKQILISPSAGADFSLPLPENFVDMSRVDDSLFSLNTTDGAMVYNTRTKKKRLIF
jgi:hypothetical protein